MVKILLLNVDPKRNLAVPMYLQLLMRNLDCRRYCARYFVQSKCPSFWNKLMLPLIAIIQLWRFIVVLKSFHPDIVHINPSLRYRAMIRDSIYLCISKALGFRVVFFVHGWDEDLSKHFGRGGIVASVFRRIFATADRVVVLSTEFKDELIKLGISAERTVVLSTMVDCAEFYPNEKSYSSPFEVLFCGAMVKEKGPYELLMASSLILNKYEDTNFIFMGVGSELNKLKNLSQELGTQNNVRFVGFRKGREKVKYFKQSHILVLPSYSEGFPLVVLEGMASGASIVTTAVGGIRGAFKDGINGFIIQSNPPNSQEIAKKIIQLMDNPKLMEKISRRNLSETAQKYDVRVVCRNLEIIYDDLVDF